MRDEVKYIGFYNATINENDELCVTLSPLALEMRKTDNFQVMLCLPAAFPCWKVAKTASAIVRLLSRPGARDIH